MLHCMHNSATLTRLIGERLRQERHASDAHAAGTRELLHLLQGAVVVEVAEQEVLLQTGDALSFPGDVAHAYANPGSSPARFSLSVFEPAVGTPVRGRTRHA